MKASDIMVSRVVTTTPDASVQDVAQLMLASRVSGLPVLDERGKLVGIISEGDLMRRTEAGTEHHRPWWLKMFMGTDALALEYVKEHARKVSDLMTRRVITATPATPVGDIAALLERNRIKRVPIVEDGKLVGIVSRANLLQALASVGTRIQTGVTADDAAIRAAVEAKLKSEPWVKSSLLNVIVHDGTVELWGIVDSQVEKNALRVAAEVTPGVRAVNEHVLIRPASYGM